MYMTAVNSEIIFNWPDLKGRVSYCHHFVFVVVWHQASSVNFYDFNHFLRDHFKHLNQFIMPRYYWNISKVGIKHQSINQSIIYKWYRVKINTILIILVLTWNPRYHSPSDVEFNIVYSVPIEAFQSL
jgi:hypothetical protein